MSTTAVRRFSLTIVVALMLTSAAGRVLAQNTVTLEGQVVCCEECWTKADRNTVEYGTAEDLLKARSCVESGDQTLLAVREGNEFKLYELEPGRFKLPGKNWLEFVGKHVTVTGTVQTKKDASVIRVGSLAVTAPSRAAREAASARGQQIELKLKDLSGVEQRLSALQGRIIVLNFWATYCIPCRKEMPDLAAIQSAYAAFGVQVIGAATHEAEDRTEVLQFVKETKVNFPIWMGATTTHMMRFGLGGALPGTVIIDRDGRIAEVISGVIDAAALKKQIEGMLAAPSPSTTVQPKSEGTEPLSEESPANEVSLVPS